MTSDRMAQRLEHDRCRAAFSENRDFDAGRRRCPRTLSRDALQTALELDWSYYGVPATMRALSRELIETGGHAKRARWLADHAAE